MQGDLCLNCQKSLEATDWLPGHLRQEWANPGTESRKGIIRGRAKGRMGVIANGHGVSFVGDEEV